MVCKAVPGALLRHGHPNLSQESPFILSAPNLAQAGQPHGRKHGFLAAQWPALAVFLSVLGVFPSRKPAQDEGGVLSPHPEG